MFSPNGKQFPNFGLSSEIEEVIAQKPVPYDLVLDGEVMSANFSRSNETGTQKRR